MSSQRIFATHRNLTGAAVPHQPDLIVWPETMYREPLYKVRAGYDRRRAKGHRAADQRFEFERWVQLWRDQPDASVAARSEPGGGRHR